MNPHLEPYWAGDRSNRLHPHWGSEFFDRIRGIEVPGSVQLFAMRRSVDGARTALGSPTSVPGRGSECRVAFLRQPHGATGSAGRLRPDARLLARTGLHHQSCPVPVSALGPTRRRGPGRGAARAHRCHDFDVFKDHDYIRKRLAEFDPSTDSPV